MIYVERSGKASTEPLDLTCSVSRWSDLHKWAQTASLLEQASPKRSGKLAWISTAEQSGGLVAIGLKLGNPSFPIGDGLHLGIAVFEIEHARSMQADSKVLLTQLAPPLAFYLQKLLAQKTPHQSLEPSSTEDQEQSESIVGTGQGLKKVMERVGLVSNSDMPVLILGDTGTGKEVIARAIHARSPRASKPFLRVNCGAIPPELIDSQLFGHERGSFTGASDQRKGWFERASGGTLFLDEVGELPLAAQVRLLRVLQEHQIERVGGEKTIDVDVRIVAATHRDLASMVHERTFREDLWYRINLFPILLPRLCEAQRGYFKSTPTHSEPRCVSLGFAGPTTVKTPTTIIGRDRQESPSSRTHLSRMSCSAEALLLIEKPLNSKAVSITQVQKFQNPCRDPRGLNPSRLRHKS